MQIFVKLYLIAVPIFFGIDLIWLSLVARKFYLSQIGDLMKTNINWAAAIIFYLLFIAGLVFFAIIPSIEKNNWQQALIYGALFGFFAYVTYDLTNLATLKNWPLQLSLVDICWGTILGGSVAVIVFFIFSKLFNA